MQDAGLEGLADEPGDETEFVDVPEYELLIDPRYTVEYQIANGQARWKNSRLDAFEKEAAKYRAWKARLLGHRSGEEPSGTLEPTLYEKLLAGRPLPPKYASRSTPGGHHCIPDAQQYYVV